MNFLQNIPRGLAVFLGGMVIVIIIVLGYQALFNRKTDGGSTSSNNGFFSSVFPFGNSSPPGNTGSSTPGSLTQAPTQSGEVPLLRQVAPDPVSGAWFAPELPSGASPLIRYMDRATGHVEEVPADSFSGTRISNTTIPRAQEIYVATSSALIIRLMSDTGTVQNIFGILNATSSQQSIDTKPMRRFERIAVTTNGTKILTVTEGTNSSEVDLSNPDGSNLQTLLVSPILSWVPLTGGSRSFLETAPSASAIGYLYEIAGGALKKIAGGAAGFTALVSPSGRYVAYSTNTSGFGFTVLDTTSGSTLPNPIGALALKCAWIPGKEPLLFCAVPKNPGPAAYPDDWLLGRVSFSDEAWILNPAKGTSYFIGALADKMGEVLDAEDISIDASGSYAIFINKKDLSLWSLRIADVVSTQAP